MVEAAVGLKAFISLSLTVVCVNVCSSPHDVFGV